MKLISIAIARICTCLTLFITAIALLSTYIDTQRPYLLEILSPFFPLYFACTIALSIIVLLTRRLRWLWFSLFCAAVLGVHVASWYLPTANAATTNSTPTQYRVMSTNLNVNNDDASKILTLTQQEQPDLAIFIEVSDSMAAQLDTLKQDFPFSTNQLTPYQPGAVIYSKYPLTDFSVKKFNTNNAVNLTVQSRIGNQPVSIVAIHPLPPITEEFFRSRNTVFDAVSAYVKQQKDPVILIGDFNVTMWSPSYKKLAEQTGLSNTREGIGILPTWPVNVADYFSTSLQPLTRFMQIPIDHCLASPDLSVTDMRIGAEVGSDHLPIVIDFSVPQADASR